MSHVRVGFFYSFVRSKKWINGRNSLLRGLQRKNEHRYKIQKFSIILMRTVCDVVSAVRAIHIQFEIYSIIYAHCTHNAILSHDSWFLIWYGRWISDNFIQCMDYDELWRKKNGFIVFVVSTSTTTTTISHHRQQQQTNGRTLFTIYKCVISFTVWAVPSSVRSFFFWFKSRDEYPLYQLDWYRQNVVHCYFWERMKTKKNNDGV